MGRNSLAQELVGWPLAVHTVIFGATRSAPTYGAEGDIYMWVVPRVGYAGLVTG